MGLGSTAKKLQKVADIAEQLFKRIDEMRGEIQSLQYAVESTETDTAELRREMAETRALVEAVAEAEDIDTEAVLEDVTYPETEGRTVADHASDDGDDSDGESSADTE